MSTQATQPGPSAHALPRSPSLASPSPTTPTPSRSWPIRWLRGAPADFAYLIVGFALAVASFSVLIAGLSSSTSLIGSVVAIPVGAVLAVATLLGARVFAAAERGRLRWVGVRLDPPVRTSPPIGSLFSTRPGFWRRWLDWFRDPQQWLDLVHGLVTYPLAVLTFTLTVAWVGIAGGGLSYPAWARYVPHAHDDIEFARFLHLPMSENATTVLIGAIFALTLVPMMRLAVTAHVGLARFLLGNQRLRALEQRVMVLTRTRTLAAEAEAQSLRTLERDLHDGPQQRLIRLGMDLATAQRRLDDDPAAVALLLAQARVQTAEALAELRDLSRGIAPPVLVDRGLEAALASVVARCPVSTTLTCDHLDAAAGGGPRRWPALVERTAYFVVSEGLANVAKHSGASAASVGLDVVTTGAGDLLRVRIEDDGSGGAHVGKGHGLAGLASRCEALDGTLEVTSPEGGPTVLTATIPCG